MNFSAYNIRHPIPAVLLFVIFLIAGLASFKALTIQSFPVIELPIVTITAVLPGATPSELEAAVTRKIEDSVASIGAVKHITSVIKDGVSVTTVETNVGNSARGALEDIRDAVVRVRSTLPADLQQPIVSRLDILGEPIVTYAVESTSMDDADLTQFVDETISKTLLAINHVEKVTRQGGIDREVRVSLDPVKMMALKVTASEVSTRLRSAQQDAPGGRVNLGGREQAVRAIGAKTSVADLAGLVIPLPDGRRIRLDQIATITDGAAEQRQLALLDGRAVVSFQVFRSDDASDISVAKAVKAAVEDLTVKNSDIRIYEIRSTVGSLQESYDVSMSTLYEGAVLAVFVVWIFLRDWRATLVSAVALPLSVIPTFAVMKLLGFSLNTVTLLALTLVVGILIDDAIVEVENIMRHLRMGKNPLQATLDAVEEIGVSVIATSLTLVAVFLPTAFMGGISGLFFKQFGWTCAVAVLVSLLVARLLTPMMAVYLLKPLHHEVKDGPLMRCYLRLINWCLQNKVKTILIAVTFFLASVSMVFMLPTSLMQSEDQSQITVMVETSPGNTVLQTRQIAEAARFAITSVAEITSVYTLIKDDVRKAILQISLSPSKVRTRSQVQIETDIRAKLATVPAARFSFGSTDSDGKLRVVLTGEDSAILTATAQQVVRDIEALPGFGNITSSAGVLRPEVHITPDFAKASDLGVTTDAIGQAIRVATIGDYDVSLSKLNLPGRQIPIRVELDQTTLTSLDALSQLPVQGAKGMITLANVADIEIRSGPEQITRFGRNRNINIDVELGSKVLGDASKEINMIQSLKHLPPGIRHVASGDAERLQETVSGFLIAMFAGIVCVYLVLVLLFHDFMQPATILVALPLSVGGALGSLMLLGYSMSMSVMIGLLMLMGIVTKNSILLVEYVITARETSGLSREEAIIDACHKRAQPILMTTIAMIAGMLPMALGLDGASTFRAPMAVTVIGGLITSTILSLLVIPVVFELIDEFKIWVKTKISRNSKDLSSPIVI